MRKKKILFKFKNVAGFLEIVLVSLPMNLKRNICYLLHQQKVFDKMSHRFADSENSVPPELVHVYQQLRQYAMVLYYHDSFGCARRPVPNKCSDVTDKHPTQGGDLRFFATYLEAIY
jgi:hypothetical protein